MFCVLVLDVASDESLIMRIEHPHSSAVARILDPEKRKMTPIISVLYQTGMGKWNLHFFYKFKPDIIKKVNSNLYEIFVVRICRYKYFHSDTFFYSRAKPFRPFQTINKIVSITWKSIWTKREGDDTHWSVYLCNKLRTYMLEMIIWVWVFFSRFISLTYKYTEFRKKYWQIFVL